MKNIFRIIFVLLFVRLAGCKLSDNDIIEENLPQLTTDSIKALTVNDMTVSMKKDGEMFTDWKNFTNFQGGFISVAGLWICAEQDGIIKGNIVSNGTGSTKRSNYISLFNKKQYGVFYLDAFTTYSSANWPVSLGAPLASTGKPRCYGDAMCWNTLFSDTTITSPTVLAKPIKGLRVNQALYGYQRNDLRYVMFIRYSITNTTSKVWNNVYIGFYSDSDVNGGGFNKTGYDSTKSICYTYDKDSYYTTGFTFLESPNNLGITSSRLMRKNNYIDPDFGEYTFTTPQQILYTLKGLSNSGAAMVNPVTKQTTKFAFTGDPVREIGWLDSPIDTRNIISSGPFTLNAGETTTVTVVWVSTTGINLADALTQMKDKIDYVRQNSSLWKF
jgi:hypothetical protein